MLTITDLHDEQELSSFEMGKVAGGENINHECAVAAATLGNVFSTMGCSDAAQILFSVADCAEEQPYYHCT
jgi:hypothetical protein